MREIKFKVWNTIDKCFVSPKSNLFSAVLTVAIKGSKHYEAHQYTGLKDSKGVEIYEGDIVECSRGIGEIAWDDGFCGFSLSISTKNLLSESSITHPTVSPCEIIGNIYENPELLEAE